MSWLIQFLIIKEGASVEQKKRDKSDVTNFHRSLHKSCYRGKNFYHEEISVQGQHARTKLRNWGLVGSCQWNISQKMCLNSVSLSIFLIILTVASGATTNSSQNSKLISEFSLCSYFCSSKCHRNRKNFAPTGRRHLRIWWRISLSSVAQNFGREFLFRFTHHQEARAHGRALFEANTKLFYSTFCHRCHGHEQIGSRWSIPWHQVTLEPQKIEQGKIWRRNHNSESFPFYFKKQNKIYTYFKIFPTKKTFF